MMLYILFSMHPKAFDDLLFDPNEAVVNTVSHSLGLVNTREHGGLSKGLRPTRHALCSYST